MAKVFFPIAVWGSCLFSLPTKMSVLEYNNFDLEDSCNSLIALCKSKLQENRNSNRVVFNVNVLHHETLF